MTHFPSPSEMVALDGTISKIVPQELTFEVSDDFLVEKLDFSYVKKCENQEELEEMYNALRSGAYGFYPDLAIEVENKLRKVSKDNSRYLYKEPKRIRKPMPNPQLTGEFNKWLSDFVPEDVEKVLTEKKEKIKSDVTKLTSVLKSDMPLNTIKNVDPSSYLKHAEVRQRGNMVIDGYKVKYNNTTINKENQADQNPDQISTKKLKKISKKYDQVRPCTKAKRSFGLEGFKDWDKFDVEKACREIDSNEESQTSSDEYEEWKPGNKSSSISPEPTSKDQKLDPTSQNQKEKEKQQQLTQDLSSTINQLTANTSTLDEKSKSLTRDFNSQFKNLPNSGLSKSAAEKIKELKKVKQDHEHVLERAKHLSEKFKQKGNDLFKDKRYEDSRLAYEKAIGLWSKNYPAMNNRALVNLKLANYQDAVDDCTHVLENEGSKNIKALFRRAQAYSNLYTLDAYHRALTDIEAVEQLDSESTNTTQTCTNSSTRKDVRDLRADIEDKLKNLGVYFTKKRDKTSLSGFDQDASDYRFKFPSESSESEEDGNGNDEEEINSDDEINDEEIESEKAQAQSTPPQIPLSLQNKGGASQSTLNRSKSGVSLDSDDDSS